MQGETVLLYNCMGRDIHVDVDGEFVLLPALERPGILDEHDAASSLGVRIGDRRTVLRLEAGRARGTMFLPEPAEGVRYLVPAEVLLRLPHRSDLVTPALYRLQDLDGPGGDPPSAGRIRCLVAVNAALAPVAEGAPNIRMEDLEDQDDET